MNVCVRLELRVESDVGLHSGLPSSSSGGSVLDLFEVVLWSRFVYF